MKFSNISFIAALLLNGVDSNEQQNAAVQEPNKKLQEHNGLRGLGVCDPVGSCANNGDQYCCGSDASKYMTCTWDDPVTNPLKEVVMPLAPGTKCCMTPFGNRITQVHLGADCPPLTPPPNVCRAVIENGVIRLGIDDEGSLINCGSGLAYDQWGSGSYSEVLDHGTLSEAFGVSATVAGPGGSSFYGGASSDLGRKNLEITNPMTFTLESAKTTVNISTGPLEVTHHFQPSPETQNLYQITVTYKNTDPTKTLKDLRYRRVMDFDVVPTYSECMSIFYQGTNPQYLEYATNNGFLGVDPSNDVSGNKKGTGFPNLPGPLGGIDDFGPMDQGALFNFKFTGVTIPPGGTFSFNIFYGAAADKTGADAAVNAVGATIGAFAFNPSPNSNWGVCSETDGSGPGVFIFGFSPVPPPCVLPSGGCMANGDQYCCVGDDSRFNVCTWDNSLNLSPIVMDVAPGTKCCQTPYGNRVTQQHPDFSCPV